VEGHGLRRSLSVRMSTQSANSREEVPMEAGTWLQFTSVWPSLAAEGLECSLPLSTHEAKPQDSHLERGRPGHALWCIP
jgi:hypothetical protein